MLRSYRFWAGLWVLSLVLAGIPGGQAEAQEGQGGGPGVKYDPQTVVTVAGIVVSTTPRPIKEGLPYLVYLILQTKQEKVTVFLGPSLYIDKQPVQVKALDKIQVTGSQVTWQGKPVILAAEIKKGDQVVKLREANGVPMWSGRGQP
jgi:hypothetical protein